jgi:hypothetical protein
MLSTSSTGSFSPDLRSAEKSDRFNENTNVAVSEGVKPWRLREREKPSSISNVQILQEWLRQQLADQNLRTDLISEAELRADSDRFLKVFSEAVQSGNLSDIQDPAYKPTLFECVCFQPPA